MANYGRLKPTELQRRWIDNLKPFQAYVASTGRLTFGIDNEKYSVIWSIEFDENKELFILQVALDTGLGYIDLLEAANELNKSHINYSFHVEMADEGNLLIESMPITSYKDLDLKDLPMLMMRIANPLYEFIGE